MKCFSFCRVEILWARERKYVTNWSWTVLNLSILSSVEKVCLLILFFGMILYNWHNLVDWTCHHCCNTAHTGQWKHAVVTRKVNCDCNVATLNKLLDIMNSASQPLHTLANHQRTVTSTARAEYGSFGMRFWNATSESSENDCVSSWGEWWCEIEELYTEQKSKCLLSGLLLFFCLLVWLQFFHLRTESSHFETLNGRYTDRCQAP